MNTLRYPTLEELAEASTISVEAAAHVIGISRQAAYDAANRGELPIIRVGRRIRVKARILHAMLTSDSSSITE